MRAGARVPKWLSGAVRETFATILPTQCAGCGQPDHSFCPGCVTGLQPRLETWPVGGPEDERSDFLEVSTALDYSGHVRAALIAFKDGGRTNIARELARPFQAAIEHRVALAAEAGHRPGTIALQRIPSTRAALRRRGYEPVGLLLKRAGLRSHGLLRYRGDHIDQAGLGVEARWQNLYGSLVAGGDAVGREIILIDDILTTGATLLEARRALVAAGAKVLGAAALAHTGRRIPDGFQRR